MNLTVFSVYTHIRTRTHTHTHTHTHRYDLLVEAGVSTPPGVIPRPHSTSSVGNSEKTQLVYEVCDHSVRYTPSSGSELQGTYVGMPKKTRSVTDVGSGEWAWFLEGGRNSVLC